MKTAAMIVIGDEVLSGRTRDENMHALAKVMTEQGINLCEARFISDEKLAIIQTVNALRENIDYVFTSGGIGPTHDDKTTDSIAAAFGVPITTHEDARHILENFYGDRLNSARLRMARVPDGALLIDNPVSQAPGFQMENVYVMAGIPMVFNAMLDSLVPQLNGSPPLRSHSLRVDLREGDVTNLLTDLDLRHADVKIGSYPFFHQTGNGLTIVARSADEGALKTCVIELRNLLHELGTPTIQETTL